MFETLKLEFKNQIAILTLNRPQALNALNSQVLSELDRVLTDLSQKSLKDFRCLIITGEGEKAFVAGADIKEINSLTAASAQKFAEQGQSVFLKIENLKVPVIAAVNGFALGGGLELALACDFIMASKNAKMGLPEVTLGLLPGFGGTVRLAKVVGIARAKEMVFSGDMINAEQALNFGLVNSLWDPAELLPAAEKLANTIATRGPVAVKAAKQSIQSCWDLDIQSAMKFEASLFSELFQSKDVVEGTTAFIEKRKAQFQGV